MRKTSLFAVAGLAVAVAACDTPTQTPSVDALMSTTVPTASGPVWVTGTYNFTVPGGSGFVNTHPQVKGYCVGSVWYNDSNVATAAKFCVDSGGGNQNFTCTVAAIPATYAWGGTGAPTQNTSANENLNFADDAYVHYNRRNNATAGMGEVDFNYSCNGGVNGSATLALSAFSGGGNSFVFVNTLNRKLKEITFGAFNGKLNLTWEYRSRNDIPPTDG